MSENQRTSERESGASIGRYRILRKIGQGGMGVVYEAYEESLDRRVALKLLPPQLSEDEEWTARFTREARTAARLEHPGIASVYGIDRTEDGTLYIAMQFVEGADLGQALRELGRLPLEVALKITREAAVALGEAHRLDIIHRDIKPDNLRLDSSGRVKVMDFGLARKTRTAQRITEAGIFLGTPEYCSPEQCEADAVDSRSDLYSLGVCLYEMLTGRIPHVAETPYSLFKKIVEEEPAHVREIDGGIPRGVDRIVRRLMAKRPEERYATAEELVADLDRQFDASRVDLAAWYREMAARLDRPATGEPTVAYRGGVDEQAETLVEGTRRATPPPAPSRRPGHAPGVAALLLLLLVAGAAGLLRTPGPALMPLLAAKTPAAGELPLPSGPARVVPSRLAILEFADGQPSPASAGFGWLKNGLPEMLSINLSRLGGLELVPYEQASKAGRDPLQAARSLGAGLVLAGKYVVAGDRLVIYARLQRYRDGTLFQVDGVRRDGPRERFLQVIDALSRELVPLFGKSGVLASRPSKGGGPRLELAANLQAASRQLVMRVQRDLGGEVPASAPAESLPHVAAGRRQVQRAAGRTAELGDKLREALEQEKAEGWRDAKQAKQPPAGPPARKAPKDEQQKGNADAGSGGYLGVLRGKRGASDPALRANRAWACYFQARQLVRKQQRTLDELTRVIALLKEAQRLAPEQFNACQTQIGQIERQVAAEQAKRKAKR